MTSHPARLCVLLLLLLPLVGSASASPGTATVTSDQWPVVDAFLDVATNDAAMQLDTASGTYVLDVAELSLELVRVQMQVLESPVGDVAYAPEYANESSTFRDARLTIIPHEGHVGYVHAWGAVRTTGVAWGLPLVTERVPETFKFQMEAPLPFFFTDTGPADALTFGAPLEASVTHVEGDARMFATNADLIVHTDQGVRTFVTGNDHRRERGLFERAPTRVDEYAFVRIDLRDARGVLHPVSLRLAAADVTADGGIQWARASGLVDVGHVRFPLRDEKLRLEGMLDLSSPVFDKDGASYTVQGDVIGVSLSDGRSFADAVPPVGVLAALAAILALVLTGARHAILSVVASLYSRISAGAALDNIERQRLFLEIKDHPDLHLRELQRRTGLGWGTLSYHLGVLRRHQLVTIHRQGKHHLVRATGTAAVRTTPLRHRGEAATIFATLEAQVEGLTQAELAERLGLSRQLVSHHLRTMLREGLVEVHAGRPRRYRPTRGRATFVGAAGESVTPPA